MALRMTIGLKDLLDKWCQLPASRSFYGADHIGALIAVEYGNDYLSNMTVPNSMFERALSDGTEKQYLVNNKDILLIPYFHGTSKQFTESKDTILEGMQTNYSHFPMALLLVGNEYTLYRTATKETIPLVIITEMPQYIGDKVSAFLGFLKTRAKES